MVTTAFPEAAPETARATPVLGPILVATDGSDDADAAFEVARPLAADRGGEPRVLAVLEPIPLLARDFEYPSWVRELNATRRDEFIARVRRQLEHHGALDWAFEVREGAPAVQIGRAARDAQASLIILGIGRHALRERLFGDETALQLLRLCDIPVLAVPPEAGALSRRAVFATDFSEASIRAMRLAVPLLKDDATVYLVHVVPRFAQLSSVFDAVQQSYIDGLAGEFARVTEALELPATMTLETITLKGSPARELLDFAAASKADLIVAGSHGQGFISRLLIGSVATYVVRGAECAALIVPQPRAIRVLRSATDRRTAAGAPHDVPLPREEWSERLKTFSGRNAGRHCRIEVDDAQLGAQAQVLDYPLLGVAYDRHDDRVEVMVGESDGTHHLTRGISGVTAMSLLVDAFGRDRLLRIEHGAGQTMVLLAGPA